MDEITNIDERLGDIFFSKISSAILEIQENQRDFVQYTSAEAGLSIIKNQEVWLRNIKYLNDTSEMRYGWELIEKVFDHHPLRGSLKKINQELDNKLALKLNENVIDIFSDTYIACIAEHGLNEEQEFGRLSMWRAYGGDTPIALVLDRELVIQEHYTFGTQLHKVNYRDKHDFKAELSNLKETIDLHIDYLRTINLDKVFSYLLESLKSVIYSSKHKGYMEEYEWRISYNPKLLSTSSHTLKSEVRSINGVEQTIYKLPIRPLPQIGYVHISIYQLLKRVLIGPTSQNQDMIYFSFLGLLNHMGFDNSTDLVIKSNIPERLK